jgi:hypothetical protein
MTATTERTPFGGWVCPESVVMSAEQITAALYAFSDLRDTHPDPTASTVRGEVGFLIARHGTEAIDRAARWITEHGHGRVLASPGGSAPAVIMHLDKYADHLAWSARQAVKMCTAADDCLTAGGVA